MKKNSLKRKFMIVCETSFGAKLNNEIVADWINNCGSPLTKNKGASVPLCDICIIYEIVTQQLGR